jgi:hypothetical protein
MHSHKMDSDAAHATAGTGSALLGPLFSEWPDVAAIVLGHMRPVDRSFLAGASRSIKNMVLESENPSDPGSVPLAVAGVTPGLGLGEFTESVEMLRYGALTYPHLLDEDRMSNSKPFDKNVSTLSACEAAVARGKLDVLQAARALGCPWHKTILIACGSGRLDILQWARAPHQVEKAPLTNDCYGFAANRGYLEVIKFLWEENCPYSVAAALSAARYGHVECLKLLHKIHSASPEARWHADAVCAYAVESRKLEVLEVAWRLSPPDYSILWPFPLNPRSVLPMLKAIETGQLDMIEFLVAHDCPWGSETCKAVRNAGHPHVSQWVEERLGACPSVSLDGLSTVCSEHGGHN